MWKQLHVETEGIDLRWCLSRRVLSGSIQTQAQACRCILSDVSTSPGPSWVMTSHVDSVNYSCPDPVCSVSSGSRVITYRCEQRLDCMDVSVFSECSGTEGTEEAALLQLRHKTPMLPLNPVNTLEKTFHLPLKLQQVRGWQCFGGLGSCMVRTAAAWVLPPPQMCLLWWDLRTY